MARRERASPDLVNRARDTIRRLHSSPLRAVADRLEPLLADVERCHRPGHLPHDRLLALANYISFLGQKLPQTFGDRFRFDAGMIQAICSQWGDAARFPRTVVPCHERDWGHERIDMPSEDGERLHVIHLVLFPGRDDLADVDLLAYPWIAHELGHNLLSRNEGLFSEPMTSSVNGVLSGLRLAAIADRGAAKARSQAGIDDLTAVWTPCPDHNDWAHEIAADVIALWTCGPAFIAAFEDVIEAQDINPFHVGQRHPPYSIRLQVLMKGARELRWCQELAKAENIAAAWKRKKPQSAQESNRLLLLSDERLIDAAVRRAFELCRALRLPPATPAGVAKLRSEGAGRVDKCGSDVLLLAWAKHQELDHTAYETWEKNLVAELASAVTL